MKIIFTQKRNGKIVVDGTSETCKTVKDAQQMYGSDPKTGKVLAVMHGDVPPFNRFYLQMPDGLRSSEVKFFKSCLVEAFELGRQYEQQQEENKFQKEKERYLRHMEKFDF